MAPNFENAVMRKVAWHLIPFLSIGYMINALDRFNVSMAALTMNTHLGLTASEYGLAAGAFFWSYVLFQFPANLMLARRRRACLDQYHYGDVGRLLNRHRVRHG